MVNDFRFTKSGERDIENARQTKIFVGLQKALQSVRKLPPATRRPELIRLFRSAVRQIAKAPIACSSDDFVDLTQAVTMPLEAFDESREESKLIIASFNEELLNYVRKHPERVRDLSGRVFEELLAEILSSLDFEDISLRVHTELGEVDVLGFSKDALGARIAYLFELKQYGQSMRPVELREVTRLYGLREGLRQRLGLSQGVFVTTTDYTRHAREAGAIYHLLLKNYESLVEWLARYEPAPNGLHLRRE